MNDTKRARRGVSTLWCEDSYSLQLARGSSHIASTLTPHTRASPIAEVIAEFESLFGLDDLRAFLNELAHRLEKRGADDACADVADAMQRAARRS